MEHCIGLAGDWHGDTSWAVESLTRFAEAGIRVVHHLGDFGFWPGRGGAAYLRAMADATRRLGLSLAVTPGNHEDDDFLKTLRWADRGAPWGRVPYAARSIAVLPRGHRWTVRAGEVERSLVSLGGAPSVDFESRLPGVSWWPGESITEADVRLTVAGGHADVMLAHDSPSASTPAVEAILAANPFGWSQVALAYAASGRAAMTAAFDGVRPRVFAHGHYHVADTATLPYAAPTPAFPAKERLVVSLADERRPGNLAVLHLDHLTVDWCFS